MQRCAFNGGNCILWCCWKSFITGLQTFTSEWIEFDTAQFYLRLFSFAGAIR